MEDVLTDLDLYGYVTRSVPFLEDTTETHTSQPPSTPKGTVPPIITSTSITTKDDERAEWTKKD